MEDAVAHHRLLLTSARTFKRPTTCLAAVTTPEHRQTPAPVFASQLSSCCQLYCSIYTAQDMKSTTVADETAGMAACSTRWYSCLQSTMCYQRLHTSNLINAVLYLLSACSKSSLAAATL